MSLSKEERDSLKNSDFAVPGKRELPIHDETHVLMAWGDVDNSPALTDSEKASARARILKRAKELGADTTSWKGNHEAFAIPEVHKLPLKDPEHIRMAANAINFVTGISDEQRMQGRINIATAAEYYGIKVPAAKRTHLHFESMALEIPVVKDHPNRHPFSGVMTRLDIASDFPVGGTTGKKVIIPERVAREAIPTLLGMAIDYTEKFDGHDRRSKIGIITEAFVGEVDPVFGTPLHIAGFFYAADFPEEVAAIQSMRDHLGFSYEAEAFVADLDSDPWVCTSCEFTGAAVLRQDKAAFTRTSISASQGEVTMALTPEQVKELEAKAAQADVLAQELATLKAEAAKTQQSAASLQHLVAPHAAALRDCAAKMCAAGIGADASNGHATVLNKMADHMEAEAVLGRIPSSFNSYLYGSAASQASADLQASIDKTVKGMQDTIESLTTKVSDFEKKTADLSAGRQTDTGEGSRKSLHPGAVAALKKIALDASAEGTYKVQTLDEACRSAGLSSQDSLALKLNLKATGHLVA